MMVAKKTAVKLDAVNQSINRSINRSSYGINQSINQSIDLPIDRSSNSISQPEKINQSMEQFFLKNKTKQNHAITQY